MRDLLDPHICIRTYRPVAADGVRHTGNCAAVTGINVTASEAQANLLSNGYSIVQSSDAATVLSNGDNFYTIYTRTSTGGFGMMFNNPAAGNIIKYSLSGP